MSCCPDPLLLSDRDPQSWLSLSPLPRMDMSVLQWAPFSGRQAAHILFCSPSSLILPPQVPLEPAFWSKGMPFLPLDAFSASEHTGGWSLDDDTVSFSFIQIFFLLLS